VLAHTHAPLDAVRTLIGPLRGFALRPRTGAGSPRRAARENADKHLLEVGAIRGLPPLRHVRDTAGK